MGRKLDIFLYKILLILHLFTSEFDVQAERVCKDRYKYQTLKTELQNQNIDKATQVLILNASLVNAHLLTNNAFASFTNVTMLDLIDNEIESIEDDAFNHLWSLELLTLAHNCLCTVPRSVFQLPKLEKLILNDNQIFYIDLDDTIFTPLRYINLEQNRLKYFPDFGVAPYLEEITVRGNDIKKFSLVNIQSLCSLQYVHDSKSSSVLAHESTECKFFGNLCDRCQKDSILELLHCDSQAKFMYATCLRERCIKSKTIESEQKRNIYLQNNYCIYNTYRIQTKPFHPLQFKKLFVQKNHKVTFGIALSMNILTLLLIFAIFKNKMWDKFRLYVWKRNSKTPKKQSDGIIRVRNIYKRDYNEPEQDEYVDNAALENTYEFDNNYEDKLENKYEIDTIYEDDILEEAAYESADNNEVDIGYESENKYELEDNDNASNFYEDVIIEKKHA